MGRYAKLNPNPNKTEKRTWANKPKQKYKYSDKTAFFQPSFNRLFPAMQIKHLSQIQSAGG